MHLFPLPTLQPLELDSLRLDLCSLLNISVALPRKKNLSIVHGVPLVCNGNFYINNKKITVKYNCLTC